MNYKDLHLEAIMIPDNVKELLAGEPMWDMEVPPFSICVIKNPDDKICWSLEFSPLYDFTALNEKLRKQGYEPDGIGWTDYLTRFGSDADPAWARYIQNESESDRCCLFTFDKRTFTILLKIVSAGIRNLYQS